MQRVLLLLFFSVSLLNANTQYPQQFSQLGDPLYESAAQFVKYEKYKGLKEEIQAYEKKLTQVKKSGLVLDNSSSPQAIKQYLHSL